MAERKRAVKTRRREKKNVPQGHVHIQATFNNTIITITDLNGAVISWGSAGTAGFKGSRKSTPYAAALSADGAAKRAMEAGFMDVAVLPEGEDVGVEVRHVADLHVFHRPLAARFLLPFHANLVHP